MASEFEYRGKWWLPDNPKNCFSGTLTFSEESGAILELDGAFTDNPEDSELFNPSIMNGTSNSGIDITLCRCLGKRVRRFSGGQSTSKLYAHKVFAGVHFQKEDEIKFRYVRVLYSHLAAWLGISGFTTEEGEEEIIFKYKSPDSIRALLSSELALSIDFGYSYRPFMWGKVDFEQSSSVTFLPAETMAFEAYQEVIHQFQNFLSLATATYVYPTRIVGTPDIYSYKIKVGSDTYSPQVEILYQLARSPQADTESYSHDYLLRFKNISNTFEKYLQSWFSKYELLKPIHQLYFGTLYNPAMYLDQKFLAFVQALEAYHRRTMDNCELPKGKHEERIKQIIDLASPKYKEWLKSKLEYSNEPSLRKRLRQLLENNKALTSKFIADSKQFINTVCIARNYLIHYDPELEDKVAKGKELQDLTLKLKVLIEACLLRQLGFSSQKVNNILSNHYIRYISIRQ